MFYISASIRQLIITTARSELLVTSFMRCILRLYLYSIKGLVIYTDTLFSIRRQLNNFKKKIIHMQKLVCLKKKKTNFKHLSIRLQIKWYLIQMMINMHLKSNGLWCMFKTFINIFDSLFWVKCLCTSFGPSSRRSPCQSLNVLISIKGFLLRSQKQ